jgi:hypothetical protein
MIHLSEKGKRFRDSYFLLTPSVAVSLLLSQFSDTRCKFSVSTGLNGILADEVCPSPFLFRWFPILISLLL